MLCQRFDKDLLLNCLEDGAMQKSPSIVQIAPVVAIIFVLAGIFIGVNLFEEQKKRELQMMSNTAPTITVAPGCRVIVRTRGHRGRCGFRRDVGFFEPVDAY